MFNTKPAIAGTVSAAPRKATASTLRVLPCLFAWQSKGVMVDHLKGEKVMRKKTALLAGLSLRGRGSIGGVTTFRIRHSIQQVYGFPVMPPMAPPDIELANDIADEVVLESETDFAWRRQSTKYFRRVAARQSLLHTVGYQLNASLFPAAIVAKSITGAGFLRFKLATRGSPTVDQLPDVSFIIGSAPGRGDLGAHVLNPILDGIGYAYLFDEDLLPDIPGDALFMELRNLKNAKYPLDAFSISGIYTVEQP